MPTYVQDKNTGKFVLKGTETDDGRWPVVHGDIEPFISPITKEVISDRGQLRRHNAKHGVTDSRDYSDEFIAKRAKQRDDTMTGNNPQAKRERVELLNQALRERGL